MSKGIVVLGQGRSGTSVVAGILHRLGVFMGERLSHHWEDGALMRLHEDLIGNDWKMPALTGERKKINRYLAFIRERQRHAVWGIKDPRLCFTFPVLAPALMDDVCIIRTIRPMEDIVASLKVYPGVTPDEASGIAWRYAVALSSLETHMDSAWPILVVDYDALVDSAEETTREIADFIQVPFKQRAAELVDAGKRHHTTGRLRSAVKLRARAPSDDAHIVEWRNASKMRFYSKQSITLESHRAWFAGQRWGFSQFFFVGECEGVPVGVISLYCIDLIKRQAEFGRILTDPAKRRRGFGEQMLKLILDFGFRKLGLRTIYCKVLVDNAPAINLYEKLHFSNSGRSRDLVYMTLDHHTWQKEIK